VSGTAGQRLLSAIRTAHAKAPPAVMTSGAVPSPHHHLLIDTLGRATSSPKPWGLGTEFDKFRALIASEIGEREFDRLTASECLSAGRPTKEEENRGLEVPDSRRRTKRLRAINRAPEIIQRLYDQDLHAVDLAAKFGPDVRNGNAVGATSQLCARTVENSLPPRARGRNRLLMGKLRYVNLPPPCPWAQPCPRMKNPRPSLKDCRGRTANSLCRIRWHQHFRQPSLNQSKSPRCIGQHRGPCLNLR
jgi:hypothetical protein